jgi:hypothetical protein
VGAARRSRPPNVCQQAGMRVSHVEVVGLDRDSVENRCDEALALFPPTPFRQLDADLQLRHGDHCHRNIIAIVDRFV